jgi:hypothetical protein
MKPNTYPKFWTTSDTLDSTNKAEMDKPIIDEEDDLGN